LLAVVMYDHLLLWFRFLTRAVRVVHVHAHVHEILPKSSRKRIISSVVASSKFCGWHRCEPVLNGSTDSCRTTLGSK
jgi:hypothetical protein